MGPGRDDRREHPRRVASLPVVLRVELHGFDATNARFESVGRTRNVSCGGLLARVDHPVELEGRVIAHFPDATGTLGRTILFGSVRRCEPVGDRWEIAVGFDTPLAEIDLSNDED